MITDCVRCQAKLCGQKTEVKDSSLGRVCRSDFIVDCVELLVVSVVTDKSGAPGSDIKRVKVPDMLV